MRMAARVSLMRSAPAAEVIASVTSLAAQSCGIGERKGRIAAGYQADLLAVAGILRKVYRPSVWYPRCSGQDSRSPVNGPTAMTEHPTVILRRLSQRIVAPSAGRAHLEDRRLRHHPSNTAMNPAVSSSSATRAMPRDNSQLPWVMTVQDGGRRFGRHGQPPKFTSAVMFLLPGSSNGDGVASSRRYVATVPSGCSSQLSGSRPP